MGVTKKRTFVKTAIYRVWILITSYIFLSIVGKSWSDSILPTLTLNFLYSIGYYTTTGFGRILNGELESN